MACEVVVGSVVYTLQLLEAHREFILDVVCALCVMSQLIWTVLVPAELVLTDTHLLVVVPPLASPVLEPFHVILWLYKVLHLHLLELAGSEDEVLGNNLVTECFSNLGNTERNLHSAVLDHVLEVYIDTLGCLRAQVYDVVVVIFHRADMGLEHKVEPSGCSKLAAALRADLVLCVLLWNLVLAETHLALLAVHQRVCEVLNMARCLPDTWVHHDGSINTYDIVMEPGHLFPPELLDILLKCDSQRAVVPCRGKTSVDLA